MLKETGNCEEMLSIAGGGPTSSSVNQRRLNGVFPTESCPSTGSLVLLVTMILIGASHTQTTTTVVEAFSTQLPFRATTASMTSNTGNVVAPNTRLFATDEAKRLMEQASKIRAEIAQMEGKSISQVEQEARDKKQREQLRSQEHKRKRQEASSSTKDTRNDGRFLEVPTTTDDMVRQAARAIERAFRDGNKKRQTVRLALLKEGHSMTEVEEWPGGAKQMYREAGKPLTRDLLRDVRAPTNTEDPPIHLPPTVKDQDIWDFDGSGLVTAEASAGPHGDVQALVFPNTDVKYINDIETLDKEMGERLLLLVNPFWRNVDSWGFNIMAPNAKSRAQEVIFDNDNFEETYVLLRFSARGERCVALKAYPYDWQLYAYKEDQDYRITGRETAVRLGSSKDEPTSALFTDLLNGRPEFKLSRNMRQIKDMM